MGPPPPPPPPPPLLKKTPSEEMVERWMKEHETYGLWLDQKRIVNSELLKIIDIEDIYNYSIKELSPRGQRDANCENMVRLMSQKAFHDYNDSFYFKRKEFLKEYEEWKKKYGDVHNERIEESFEKGADYYDALLRPKELEKALIKSKMLSPIR